MGLTTGVIILMMYYFFNIVFGAFTIGDTVEITPGRYAFQIIIWTLLVLAVIFL